VFNTQGLPLDFRRRIILALSLKQAIEEEIEEEALPSVSKMRDAVRLISGRAYRVLFKEFKSRLMPFFDLYGLLHAHSLEEAPAPPEGFSEAFRGYSRLVFTSLRSPEAENEFSALASKLRPMLNRIDSGASDHALAVRVGQVYAQLIQTVTQDREIYLTLKPSGRWFFLRMMGDKEQQIERLKKEDPELYDTLQKSKEVSKTLDLEVEKAIAGAGMIPSRKWIMGRPAHIGADPVTKEEVVFTEDGAVTPVDDYVAKRKQNLRAQREQERVFPEDLDQLRKVSATEIEQVASQPVSYVALTDDVAKSSAVTRIYPVKKINGNDVVVDGRFKGFLVPDLVNAAGRLIEGVAYDFDPKLGRPIPIETKNRDGSINIRSLQREPYVTVSQGKLLLRIPSVGEYTTHRNRVAELQKLIPSMKYIEHSRKSLYTFEPKDFSAVRNALGGLSFSTAAMKLIRAYFVELAKHELATSNENLKNYEAEAIGGFRQDTKLLTKQKESLAWMESRGNSGVIALDTGVGKTLTALAAIQKMRRDGSAEARFLYVCPPTLRGNLIKEAYQFMEDPKTFLKQVDIMSYRQFTMEMQKNPELGKQYEAIFFDEAHELKNPTSDQTKAAMSMKHPRKVLMTASPMERSPMEVFTLAAIADNIDLNTPEGRVAIRAFRKRFAEEVGGRIVGIKDDPTTLRDMRVWVRKSLFFADKRTVEEFVLPKLTKTTDTVTMDAEVEAKYRETASGISDVLRGLTLKYRDREISPETQNKALETARIKLADLFSKLTKLSNLPEKVVPGARNHKLDRLVQIMDQKAGSMSRVVVFTDSPELAQAATEKLVERCPWTSHALALAGKIEIFKAGGSHDTYTKREYKDAEGNKIPAKDWQLYIMKTLVAGDHSVGSVTLTSAYSVGQNLQEFDTVIHLDRDTWNSETIKQRTARLWRQGQDKPVDEYTLDTVYQSPQSEVDSTLDQIRKYVQELESDLFDSVVIESQTEALGAEFFKMKRMHSSFFKLNRRMMEMALSPYIANLRDLK
jgi:hypothetical protein